MIGVPDIRFPNLMTNSVDAHQHQFSRAERANNNRICVPYDIVAFCAEYRSSKQRDGEICSMCIPNF